MLLKVLFYIAEQTAQQSMDKVIEEVFNMISWDHDAQKLAKASGMRVQMVSWEGLSSFYH